MTITIKTEIRVVVMVTRMRMENNFYCPEIAERNIIEVEGERDGLSLSFSEVI